MRLLVVDDEAELADAVARGLRAEGYAVDIASNGDEALEKLGSADYDLVCLDLTMPGVDGRQVCRRIRSGEVFTRQPRVLMLTARDGVTDRVQGLDDGADDYLVKPFAFSELSARVRTLLRRHSEHTERSWVVGDLEVDTATRRAWRSDVELALTAKEFALLRYFVAHVGEVLSQEELLEHVWDEHADPFTNTVRVTVGTLRRKLAEDGAAPLIHTVVGAGYRLEDPTVVSP